jgi:tetratricopeptide (TPR) repeat protein
LLETVRQYAAELLEASGEAPATRSRHLAFYLDFAEKARPELSGRDQGEWLERLDADHANLLSAHSWCESADGGAELGLRLASALRPYWLTRGQAGLGAKVFGEALARRDAQRRDRPRCRALADAGQIAYFMGRYGEAQRYLEESLAIARELGDTRRVAAALQPLGNVRIAQGDFAGARKHLEEGLHLARELGNQRDLAAATNQLAQLKRVEGDVDAAEPLYEQVLAIARELGDHETIAIGLLNLAMTTVARRQLERARAMATEAHAIVQEVGLTRVRVSVLEVCAGLASAGGQMEAAARLFGAAEQLAAQSGMRRSIADEAYLKPLIDRARQALGAGFNDAEGEGRALGYEAAMQSARDSIAA